MWTLTIIIVVVVVVDHDTYYWVYLSSDHLFQVYYKVWQVLLQSATAFLLQSAMVCYYKVWQLFYYKVRQVLLQSATGIRKCDSFITKCHDFYKVRQYRQYSVKNQLPLEKEENLWRIFGKSRVKNYFQHQSLLAEFLKSSTQLLKLKTV